MSTTTTSRRKFKENLSTNSHVFAAAQNQPEIVDTSVLCLTVTTWTKRTFREFAHLCRLLFNFGLRRVVIMVQAENYKCVCNKLIIDVFNDPTFLAISTIKQPKASILMHALQKKHLKLHVHQIISKFSVQSVDQAKLQCILAHYDSVSQTCFSSASSMAYAPFIFHNLSSLSCVEKISKISSQSNKQQMTHIFHGSLDAAKASLPCSTLFTFAVQTYRQCVPLMAMDKDGGDAADDDDDVKSGNTGNCNDRSECIPVMYEWKTGYNIGKILQVARHFKIAAVIHILKEHKTHLYQNDVFLSTIASQCCGDARGAAQSMDALKSMLDLRVLRDAPSALQVINDLKLTGKNTSEGKICVLVLSADVFLELLKIDQQRSLVVMETVTLGNQSMPIKLSEFIAQRRQSTKRLQWYGIVGRESYGIKPRYLYDLYKTYEPAVGKRSTETVEKECRVVYVQTSKLQPSLNASTALSLLVWANESFSAI